MKNILKSYLKYLYAAVVKDYSSAFFLLMEKNSNALVIDAGCSDGTNTVEYGRIIGTKKLVGLELVESAALAASKKGIKASIANLNFEIKLNDNVADVVISNHVIEHLYNVESHVAEIYRILKPGGYLVIGTPNLASWHNVFALIIGKQPFSGPTVKVELENSITSEMRNEKMQKLTAESKGSEDSFGHIVVLTYKTLICLLKSKGFIIEKSYGFGYHPFPPMLARFFAKIDKKHAHYILIKARKPKKGTNL
jgi:SAM-dependent methyltransferase